MYDLDFGRIFGYITVLIETYKSPHSILQSLYADQVYYILAVTFGRLDKTCPIKGGERAILGQKINKYL